MTVLRPRPRVARFAGGPSAEAGGSKRAALGCAALTSPAPRVRGWAVGSPVLGAAPWLLPLLWLLPLTGVGGCERARGPGDPPGEAPAHGRASEAPGESSVASGDPSQALAAAASPIGQCDGGPGCVSSDAEASAPAQPRCPSLDADGGVGAEPLAPLMAAASLEPLPLDGFAPAVVSLPLGARCPKPVLVATHGNYDRPEWQCEQWRQVVDNRAFVVCPRGTSRADSPSSADVRFTYPNNQQLEREVEAALAALAQRYRAYVASGPPLYAGFSLGAIMGVAIATRQAERYPRLVLVEGGSEWTWSRAKLYAKASGTRVLFVCSQPGCRAGAREAARKLEATGVPTRQIHVPGLGHAYGGALNEPIREAWPWLTEGDPRWAP